MDALIADPWNGSGTTTSEARFQGYDSHGIDLNPAMVLIAKARSLDTTEYPHLRPLATSIQTSSAEASVSTTDPLLQWLTAASVIRIRNIEAAIQKLLISDGPYRHQKEISFASLSNTAAFFYLALFRTVKSLTKSFRTSNPTWIKTAKNEAEKIKLTKQEIISGFVSELAAIFPEESNRIQCISKAHGTFSVASSENLPLNTASVDLIISSPPYCTRIDYAVATRIELAILGYDSEFHTLRESLMGTSTVSKCAASQDEAWGNTCLTFLDRLSKHKSKASSTYYLKSHLAYFNSLSISINEIARVLKPGANCHLVVQDSYYKNVHNDLPKIVTEMGASANLQLLAKKNFTVSRTLAGVNPGVKAYRKSFGAVESVLSFRSVAH